MAGEGGEGGKETRGRREEKVGGWKGTRDEGREGGVREGTVLQERFAVTKHQTANDPYSI